MTVKELVDKLTEYMDEYPDVDVSIVQSQYDWENVLAICTIPYYTDEWIEIRL